METQEKIYSYFYRALRYYIQKGGHGSVKQIAGDVGISGAYLSQILSDQSPKKATPDKQRMIAKACGHDDFESFLKLGKNLLRCDPKPGTKQVGVFVGLPTTTNDIPLYDPENDSDINPTETQEGKVGDVMVSTGNGDLLAHYKEELAALRDEINYLRTERNALREELNQAKPQDRPDEGEAEKKTAV